VRGIVSSLSTSFGQRTEDRAQNFSLGRILQNGIGCQAFADEQERYNQVLGAYLAETISLAHAAELLELPVINLRFRFARLDLPLRLGSATQDELSQEVEQASTWGRKANP
jgi:hypothetical protein